MDPIELGGKYDRIAAWWQHRHRNSDYGVGPPGKALGFVRGSGKALMATSLS